MSTIKAINIIHPSSSTANLVLNADGSIQTPNINSAFPAGTTLLFYQATAPTGWTQVTTQNDKALRVVSGTGGGTGGSTSFSSTFTTRTGSVDNTTLTTTQIPSHIHGGVITSSIWPPPGGNYTGPQGAYVTNASGSPYGGADVYLPGNTGSQGGGGAHNHSYSIGFSVQYIDVIIASKN